MRAMRSGPKYSRNTGSMSAASPLRDGAPGLSTMAPQRVTTAVSSTKHESGNSGSGPST